MRSFNAQPLDFRILDSPDPRVIEPLDSQITMILIKHFECLQFWIPDSGVFGAFGLWISKFLRFFRFRILKIRLFYLDITMQSPYNPLQRHSSTILSKMVQTCPNLSKTYAFWSNLVQTCLISFKPVFI